MHAAEIMTRDVATVAPDTPLTTIAELLLSRRISGVPVVEADGKLVGIVSEADLMWRAEGEVEHARSWWATLLSGRAQMAADEFIKTHGTRADDIMTRDVTTVAEDTPVEQVVDLFERHRVKRLPVVKGDRLVGVVSRKDILKSLAATRPDPLAAKDDNSLQSRLLEMLARQNWTDLGRVNVVVENGIVRFNGMVGSEVERRALHVAAHSIPGIRAVEDELTLGHRPAGGM